MSYGLEEFAAIRSEVGRRSGKVPENPERDFEVIDRGCPAPERCTTSTHKGGADFDIVVSFAIDQNHPLSKQVSES
jgi:hypothetical protein